MTSSFQPQARPVDTFVRPSTVAPTTELDQLTRALQTVNPGINKFIDFKLDQVIEDEQAEGTEIAIEKAANNFKDITKSVKKTNGDAAARQLIGGSIFAQKAYERTKAQILGNNIKSKLTNSYSTTSINGKPLTAYPFESPEFQGWLTEQRNQVVDQLDDVNATYVNKYFLPNLAESTGTITSHHIKQHKEYKFEQLKSLTTPLVNQVLAGDDDDSKVLIQGFELSMNQLGIQGEDRQKVNKMIVEALADEAEALGLSEGGSLEDAIDILDKAKLFPYGPGGQLDLSQHPDFKDESTRIKKAINDYEWKQSQREIAQQKREKEKSVDTVLKGYSKLLDAADKSQDPTKKKQLLEQAAKSLEDLRTKYPDLAPKINNIVTNLDGDTQDRYAQLLGRIKTGGFESKSEAQLEALQFLQDERTPDTPQNTKLYDNLMRAIDDVEDGQYVYANKLLTELKSQIKGELSNVEGAIFFDSGALKGPAASEKNRLFNEASDDFYDWIDKFKEEKNKAPSKTEQREYFNDNIRKTSLDKAKSWKPKNPYESGVTDKNKSDNKKEIKSDNKTDTRAEDQNSDLQGPVSSNLVIDTVNQLANALTGTRSAAAGTLEEAQERGELMIEEPQIITTGNGVERMESNFPTIYKLAKNLGIKFPEVVAAQFGEETSWGLSPSGKNNYWGLKATRKEIEDGQSTLTNTEEEINGKDIKIKDHFKDFSSITEALLHYKKYWNDGLMDNVESVEEAVQVLKANGYATNSDYVRNILKIIENAKSNPPLF